jgi:hypothetical protein
VRIELVARSVRGSKIQRPERREREREREKSDILCSFLYILLVEGEIFESRLKSPTEDLNFPKILKKKKRKKEKHSETTSTKS